MTVDGNGDVGRVDAGGDAAGGGEIGGDPGGDRTGAGIGGRPPSSWPVGPLAGALVGVPVIAFGAWGLLHDSQRTRPGEAVRWIVGSAVIHDLIALPLLLGASLALVRPLPSWSRATVRAGLAVSAVLALVAWPEIAGYGENPTNPSLLPRDEAAGLLAYLAAVWLVVGFVLIRQALLSRQRPRRS